MNFAVSYKIYTNPKAGQLEHLKLQCEISSYCKLNTKISETLSDTVLCLCKAICTYECL